jgi:hypothetical protein
MNKYGLEKILKDGENEIKLVGNAVTFILYKSYFGRDLLNDIIQFAKANADKTAFEKLLGLGVKSADDIEKLTEDQLAGVYKNMDDITFDTEFVLNFIASLMATAQYPSKPDVAELICAIPPHFVIDQGIVTELLEFLSLFISQKKG